MAPPSDEPQSYSPSLRISHTAKASFQILAQSTLKVISNQDTVRDKSGSLIPLLTVVASEMVA